ncbi:MAG TPA: hypothetical protein VFY44_13350, partial [Thermoleophilaceae bacterium]|nr:hypothetical protein [Thermoleophilaceae bacterium]
MARNRQKAKERQARRKAQKGNGDAKSAPPRRQGDDPIADDVLDELERESITEAGADPTVTPPLSGSERLRAPDAAEADAEPELGYPDIENDPEHFDPAEDQPEDVDDLTP